MTNSIFISHLSFILAFSTFAEEAQAPSAINGLAESTREVHGRLNFERGLFGRALYFLDANPKLNNPNALLMRAESLFRLHHYAEAGLAFLALLALSPDLDEQRTIMVRVFDIAILEKNLSEAMRIFADYEDKFKNPPEIMIYALGKALFDAKSYDEAHKLFKRIKEPEFAMRAQFLLAIMNLDIVSNEQSIKYFAHIENMKCVSVEDFGVRELAILAQARLLVLDLHYEEAKKLYEKIPLNSTFAEEATLELSEAFLEKGDIKTALLSIERYGKHKKISVLEPELWTLLGSLLAASGRFVEARIAFRTLIDHYQPLSSGASIEDVPQKYLQDLPGLRELRALKRRLDESEKKLLALEEGSKAESLPLQELKVARENQSKLAAGYEQLALAMQPQLVEKSAEIIKSLFKAAEFKLAELNLLELQNIRKQEEYLHKYQKAVMKSMDGSP